MAIKRIKIPEQDQSYIEDLREKAETAKFGLVISIELAKECHTNFWKAIHKAIPELEAIDYNIHYLVETREVYWIDGT